MQSGRAYSKWDPPSKSFNTQKYVFADVHLPKHFDILGFKCIKSPWKDVFPWWKKTASLSSSQVTEWQHHQEDNHIITTKEMKTRTHEDCQQPLKTSFSCFFCLLYEINLENKMFSTRYIQAGLVIVLFAAVARDSECSRFKQLQPVE